jgi:AAA+ ATPase superfamily predicted ATPase
MEFINRSGEMERLDALIARPEGGFVVLWGRRRVGKTRLLLEWSSRHQGFYTVADESASAVQRSYFARAVADRFPGFDEVTYPDWRALLRRLSQLCQVAQWRGPLIIDELPCLVEANPSFASIFQNWLDHEAHSSSLVVAVAGSSQRMMQGLVLESTAPLYGRAVELIELRPLLPGYIADAFGELGPRRSIELYALWGGIPRYWELALPLGGDLDRAVDRLVLDPTGPLHREPERLLMEESPPAVSLRPLLDLIGAGANRVSEIAGRLGQPATSLSRPLARLVQLGLVKRELPYGELEKGSKLAVYRIADPFFRFWFSTVAPRRSLFVESPAETRLAIWRERRTSLESDTWEEVCRLAVPYLHRGDNALSRLGPWEPARRYWRGKGPEWDIVASSLDGRRLLLGEAKWLAEPADSVMLGGIGAELMRKGTLPATLAGNRQIVWAVFVPELRRGSEPPAGVQVVDAAAVISCLR